MSRLWWGVAAGALALASGAVATMQMQREASSDDDLPDVLLEQLYPGTTIEQYVAGLAQTLRAADPAGDGLDADDVALAGARETARGRASAVGEALAHDLNGDLVVTRAEVTRGAAAELGRSRAVDAVMDRFDGDGDDRITVAEAAAAAAPTRGDGRLSALLALDPDRDGRFTAAELRTRAERVFARLDRDGDGTLDRDEYEAVAKRIRDAQAARNAPVCSLPPLPRDARLVAYAGYEADAISSVAVGGPDQETNLMEVTIEPGREPLYLVLSSYESMVWRLSGATGRVARVVVSSYHTGRRAPVARMAAPRATVVPPVETTGGPSASGVVGVPAARVTIAARGCPNYASDPNDAAFRGTLQRALGRAPHAVAGVYSAQRVSLPSGAIIRAPRDSAPAPAGFDPGMWREATRYWPGGLVRVDPASVVAAVRVAPYQVLPSQMGLAQLVGAGAAVREGGDTFRIVRPIAHMPPSMGGAHSARLVFARGVPVPPGDPVHSCIVREDGGEATGARCAIGR